MSNVNIFKIKMVQPNCIQNRLRGVLSNQLVPKRKQQKPVSVFFNQSQSLNNNTPHKNSNNTFKDNMDLLTVPIKRRQRKQSDTYRSQRSASFVRSHRAYKKTINQQPILLLNNLKLTKQRPQSAMLKKSRKRSWEQYKNKLPLFAEDDIFFRKNEELTEGILEQYVAFYKKKGIFVRVIKSKVDWDWEPINNQYVIKIFGRISIRNQMYFIVQNFNNTSIRDIINCFGPCKESLVKKQIRSLVCGVIHCHNRGFVHNRLNPDNIYMNKEGNFLIDIVKSTLSGPTQKQKQKYYHYFSPELLKENISAQSCDVWAIGCLTLQILTGKIKTSILHPYHQSNQASPTSTQSILRQIKQQSQNYIIKQNLGSNEQILNNKQIEISKSARSFIAACLKVNYKTRPQLSILIDHDFLRLFS